MTGRIAFISQGKLYLKDGDGEPTLVASDFAQDAVSRTIQAQQKNQWKGQGGSQLISGAALWNARTDDPKALKIAFTGVTRGDSPGQFKYTLSTSAVGGMFAFDVATRKENRLFHRESVWLKDLDRHPTDDLIVCSQIYPNGTACISTCEGPRVQQITEGDAVDEAPSWVPGTDREIVFQSAGVARNSDGYALGLGPVSVQRLNLQTGEMTPVVEDAKYDYLLPHVLPSGELVAIKRPYEPAGRLNYPIHKMLLDAVLFPFRVARALFHFLDFFSLVFSKKPLTAAGGPQMEGLDVKQVILRGRMIDAEKALKERRGDQSVPSLVPDSWQLVRRKPDGSEEVLASSVAAFDIDGAGEVVHSNGMALFALDEAGKSRLLGKWTLIESVACLD